jgi:hypothetical protein
MLGSRDWAYGVDVWSVGCVLIELYIGKKLFPTGTKVTRCSGGVV